MRQFRVGPLPERAIEAAAAFHAGAVPEIVRMLQNAPSAAEDVVLIFAPASYDHRAWRLAAVQDLARAAAPIRVNGIAGEDETAIAEALEFLQSASGVTGQFLAVQSPASAV
jgi:hypothetical protein